ncbi:unnamed protein product [Caenorhabditis angaria]|uniref:Uncharacterized protein n=1 Tax=Caenorhabditis angaria TaxID=860376 RepID=A0A9P1N8Y5_9PELO|nr:unnamed protein product [Caenorhabditis angaria]
MVENEIEDDWVLCEIPAEYHEKNRIIDFCLEKAESYLKSYAFSVLKNLSIAFLVPAGVGFIIFAEKEFGIYEKFKNWLQKDNKKHWIDLENAENRVELLKQISNPAKIFDQVISKKFLDSNGLLVDVEVRIKIHADPLKYGKIL